MNNSLPTLRAALTSFVVLAGTTFGTVAGAESASAEPSPGYSVHVFATGTATRFGPDDLVHLGSDVFVAWQNGVGSTGSPSTTGNTRSTLVQYRPDGDVVAQWSLTGKIDGLGADPDQGRVIATVNEDGNSSLYTVAPWAPAGSQVKHYHYAPSGGLPHGGGTDSVTVIDGHTFIAASAPTVSDGPAVYEATLAGSTATLRPVFFDNSTAKVANTNASNYGQPVTLALTDPDSTTRVPGSSPRFAGDFLLDSQGDQQQIYVSNPGTDKPRLSVLNLTQSVDDTAFVTDQSGTLYSTDNSDNEVFAITGDFQTGTAFTSVTPGDANNPVNAPNYLGQLNLRTGHISPVIQTIKSQGLMFVGAAD